MVIIPDNTDYGFLVSSTNTQTYISAKSTDNNERLELGHDGVPINFEPMTTAQRDAIANSIEGDIVFNSTFDKLNKHDGTSWADVGGSGGFSMDSLSAPVANATNIFADVTSLSCALNVYRGYNIYKDRQCCKRDERIPILFRYRDGLSAGGLSAPPVKPPQGACLSRVGTERCGKGSGSGRKTHWE